LKTPSPRARIHGLRLAGGVETPIFASAKSNIELALRAFDSGDQSSELALRLTQFLDRGMTEPLVPLAMMYEDGSNGLARDPDSALEFYERAAAFG
jgi:TPR repeat protein